MARRALWEILPGAVVVASHPTTMQHRDENTYLSTHTSSMSTVCDCFQEHAVWNSILSIALLCSYSTWKGLLPSIWHPHFPHPPAFLPPSTRLITFTMMP
jgi:hypothetical protein